MKKYSLKQLEEPLYLRFRILFILSAIVFILFSLITIFLKSKEFFFLGLLFYLSYNISVITKIISCFNGNVGRYEGVCIRTVINEKGNSSKFRTKIHRPYIILKTYDDKVFLKVMVNKLCAAEIGNSITLYANLSHLSQKNEDTILISSNYLLTIDKTNYMIGEEENEDPMEEL